MDKIVVSGTLPLSLITLELSRVSDVRPDRVHFALVNVNVVYFSVCACISENNCVCVCVCVVLAESFSPPRVSRTTER